MSHLRGEALLSYLKEHAGEERDKVIAGAGYVVHRAGRPSLQRTKFFSALAEANGHELGPSSYNRPEGFGQPPGYRLRVGPKGMIPVSRAYSNQCNMEPGTYVRVIIEDGAIILEPEEEADTQPPTARLMEVA